MKTKRDRNKAKGNRTTEQVLASQGQQAAADTAQGQGGTANGTIPPSATASQTTDGNLDAFGGNVAAISQEAAIQNIRAHGATLQEQTLAFVAAGAVAYIVMVKANAKGKLGYSQVTGELQKAIAERNVKRSMAYSLLQTAQQLATFLDRTYHQGGIVHEIMTNASALMATSMLVACLKTDHGVSSYNTLRQAIIGANGAAIEATWDDKAKAEAAAARAKASTPQAKAAQTRMKMREMVQTVAADPVAVESAIVAAGKRSGKSLVEYLTPILARISTVDEIDTLITAATTRKAELLATPVSAESSKKPASEPAHTSH